MGSSSKDHHHHTEKHHHSADAPKRGLHRDWRLWTAVALMLAAMFAYVMSGDEALQPGGGPRMPAEAAE